MASIGYDVSFTALQPYVRGLAEWDGPIQWTPYYGLGQTAWLDK